MGISTDTPSGILAMQISQGISFPLISNSDLITLLGLENPNMNRAPVTVLIGKNLVKYWVYEGTKVSDRPSIGLIKEQINRVKSLYQ